MNQDPGDMLRDDLEKFQRYQGQGLDSSLPAMIELGLGTLTALTALVWMVSLFWVGDVIDGTTWMGLGGLGLVLFGVPTGVIYGLRRGGVEIIRAIVREYMG